MEVIRSTEMEVPWLELSEMKENSVTGGFSGFVKYQNPLAKFSTRPAIRFIQSCMVAAPGLEPRDGQFYEEDGKWNKRKERPEWDQDAKKAWVMTLTLEDISSTLALMKRVSMKLCKLAAAQKDIPLKKVTLKDFYRPFGDNSNLGGVEVRVPGSGIIFDGDDTDGNTVSNGCDYPINARDTLRQVILEPAFPFLREDSKNKGKWIFSVNWVLRMANMGEPKPVPVQKTEAEIAEENKKMFTPTNEEESKKRPLETDSEDPPQQKKQK